MPGFPSLYYLWEKQLLIRNFRLNIALRVLMIVITAFALVYVVFFTQMYVVTFLTGLAVIGLVIELIRYIDKTNRDIAAFLLSIRHDDYSTTFSEKKVGRSFHDLYRALNLITGQFQRIRAEKESNFRYLQTVVEHVNVGLICYDEHGKVQLMNRALSQLLGKPYFHQFDALEKVDPKLQETLAGLESGQRELVKIQLGGGFKQLAIQAVEFKLQNEPYRLISMQDIQGELEENELEAWQKLIRILTHEIMNSVSPITSLTGTLKEILAEDEELAATEAVEDLRAAVHAIHKRSEGLLHFTGAYRDLTRLPAPELREIPVQELLGSLPILFKAELEETHIDLKLDMPAADLLVRIDPELIEQVLINLIQNAIDALKDQSTGKIGVSARATEEGKVQIRVRDNGPGIPDELIEQIFVPFFTTKDSGSGIGLSLSRQILRLHKGSLSVHTEPGQTIFSLLV